MNITCPNCGAVAYFENCKATCECPYCGTKLSINNHTSGIFVPKNKNISTYIELAESALRGKDYKGFKKYVDLALEQNVHDSKLWWYKTLAEAKHIINVRNRTSWIFECGEKSILYAEDKQRAAADIYLVYIELAIDKLTFMKQWPKPDLFEEPDSDVIVYEKDIVTLIRKIPKDIIEQYPVVKEKMVTLSQCWLSHINLFPGSLTRCRYLKEIYLEISPLSDSEKKKEMELFGKEFYKNQHNKNTTENNPWLGCIIILFIFLAFLGCVNHFFF